MFNNCTSVTCTDVMYFISSNITNSVMKHTVEDPEHPQCPITHIYFPIYWSSLTQQNCIDNHNIINSI